MPNTKPLLGRDCFLYVNTGVLAGDGTGTWTEADLATDVTKDESKDDIEVTNRQSARGGWKAFLQGLKQFKIDFDTHLPALGETANAANTALIDAFYSGAEVEVVIAEGNIVTGTDIPATFVTATVGGGSESQPLNDAVTKALSITNYGTPLRGTYTTNTPTLS